MEQEGTGMSYMQDMMKFCNDVREAEGYWMLSEDDRKVLREMREKYLDIFVEGVVGE